MNLQELQFSDLFVAEAPANCWFKPTPDSLNVVPIGDACANEVMQLRAHLIEQSKKSGVSFRIEWPASGGLRMRVGVMKTSAGQSIFVCRRLKLIAQDLSGLGVPAPFISQLMSPSLKDGLVVFMGSTGSGKTTTAATFIAERLRLFGGVCWSVENPIEIPLEGVHGKGRCYQTEVGSDSGIGLAIRDMLRASPNIIYIGELRDSSAVREAITASVSGHLVVTTFHSGSLVSGLQRLAMLADNDKVSAALGDALRVAAHLNLYVAEDGKLPPRLDGAYTSEGSKGTGSPPRILSFTPLWMNNEFKASLQTMMREGHFEMLGSTIDQQLRNAMTRARA